MLLAIETSSRVGSIALVGPSGVLAEVRLDEAQRGASLAPAVRDLVGDRAAALTGYAISVGPGSFTGLRIGAAFLKGYAFVHRHPAVAVCSLEVLAASANVEGPVLASLDARRDEVFAALFTAEGEADPRLPVGLYPRDEVRARVESAGPLTLVGDGSPVLDARPDWTPTDPGLWIPRAAVLGLRAWPRWAAGEGIDPLQIEPAYHQRSAAEVTLGISVD